MEGEHPGISFIGGDIDKPDPSESLGGSSTQPEVPVMLDPGVSVGVDSSSRPTPLRTVIVSFKDPSLEQVTEFVCLVEHVPVETRKDFYYDPNFLN